MDFFKNFSEDFSDSLKRALAEAEKRQRKIAVFDADWTLWSADMGEAFLRWLIAGRLLLNADYSADIYREYEKKVEINRAGGYAWAVSLMAGLSEEDIKLWSGQMAYAWPNYRSKMRLLVGKLRENGFEVWIISASNDWVIKAAARHMSVEPEKSLGIRVGVENGLLTDEVVKPVTCNYGKVETIMQRIGEKPLIACGDSMGDLEMLEYSEIPLIAGKHEEKDSKIIEIARSRNWPVHFF
ncbi:MAG: HAD-IB family phosphatase [Deltaproteobacteria bacterium]|nr:HAD-IB family phosphatase [Deltaproteobacteria bacterium]